MLLFCGRAISCRVALCRVTSCCVRSVESRPVGPRPVASGRSRQPYHFRSAFVHSSDSASPVAGSVISRARTTASPGSTVVVEKRARSPAARSLHFSTSSSELSDVVTSVGQKISNCLILQDVSRISSSEDRPRCRILAEEIVDFGLFRGDLRDSERHERSPQAAVPDRTGAHREDLDQPEVAGRHPGGVEGASVHLVRREAARSSVCSVGRAYRAGGRPHGRSSGDGVVAGPGAGRSQAGPGL